MRTTMTTTGLQMPDGLVPMEPCEEPQPAYEARALREPEENEEQIALRLTLWASRAGECKVDGWSKEQLSPKS